MPDCPAQHNGAVLPTGRALGAGTPLPSWRTDFHAAKRPCVRCYTSVTLTFPESVLPCTKLIAICATVTRQIFV